MITRLTLLSCFMSSFLDIYVHLINNNTLQQIQNKTKQEDTKHAAKYR